MIAVYVIVGLIALILIVAAFVGTSWSYEQSISIHAPVNKVWPNVNSLHALNNWNPWVGKDPAIKVDFAGSDGAVGATYSWDSQVKEVGAGSQTIVKIDPNTEMATRVDFLRPFKGTGNAYIRIAPESAGTKATWLMESSTPYPMNIIKLFGVIEKNMSKDFGIGLNKLKSICEQKS